MKMTRSKNVIAAGIALTLALGGGALYAGQSKVFAAAGSTSATDSGSSQAQTNSQDKQNRPSGRGGDFKGKGGEGRFGVNPGEELKLAAEALGIGQDALMKELKAGKSIADVATAQNVSLDTVTAKLTDAANKRIDTEVTNGKLTADQAATVKTKVADQVKKLVEAKGLQGLEGREGGFKGGFGGGGMEELTTAAGALGIDQDALTKELKAGKSIADVATAQNVSLDTVTAKLTDAANKRIDDAVTNGKLTAEQATTAKTKVADQVKKLVEAKGLQGPEGHGGKFGGGMDGVSLDNAATIIGVTKEELKQELAAGKSLTEIAQAKGIDKDTLIAKLQDAIKPQLEKFVDRKGTNVKNHQSGKNGGTANSGSANGGSTGSAATQG